MKIPLSWLKEYITLELTPEEIADKLTSAGLEVEGLIFIGSNFKNVTTAEILSTEKHPNADRLTIVKVNNGKEELQIVCGASNCRSGMKVALAEVGAILFDEQGKEFVIKQSKIRGIESFGMLCAAEELGLAQTSDGILELPSKTKPGYAVSDLFSDTIFDISLTPNLSHCTSVLGVARELSAVLDIPYRLPQFVTNKKESYDNKLEVKVLNSKYCPRYLCRIIKNVKVMDSPDWLKARLEKCGQRSINNIIDITNYVLLEMGHPLHAFDYDRLDNQQIVVRLAREGESINTLDGKTRGLNPKQLVIADAHKPIAIAGVMGGENSEVTEQTQTIVLECAYFEPVNIRLTSRELNLSTDASKRFERGTDPNQLPFVLDYATSLIEQLTGGTALRENIEIKAQDFEEKSLICRLDQINRILGTSFGKGEIETIFNSLNFIHNWSNKGHFIVKVPTYRTDISMEIDLIEEIARIYGYNHISLNKTVFSSSLLPSDENYLFEKTIRNLAIDQGLQEFLTCDLIGPSLINIVQDQTVPPESIVKVLNPTSVEQSILRTSLLPGLLQVVKHNIDHQNPQIAGFEIGRLHFKENETYKEPSVLGIILSGKSLPHQWDNKAHIFDFFDLKGIIENILKELGIHHPIFKNLNIKTLHTGRQASVFVEHLEIGSIGEIHPAILRRLDVSQRVLFGEFNLKDLRQVAKPIKMIRPLINFPGTERDWTITINEKVSYSEIIDTILKQASPILEEVYLLDIYRSDKLPTNHHNLTLRFKYRDLSKTIEIETVEIVHKRLVTEVLQKFATEIKL